jgi:hypothetical protein
LWCNQLPPSLPLLLPPPPPLLLLLLVWMLFR